MKKMTWQQQQGMTLVELMIAIVLGLMVSAAAIQLFLANKRSYLLIENNATMQEQAIMSKDIFTRSAAIAGYVPDIDSYNNGNGALDLFPVNAISVVAAISPYAGSGTKGQIFSVTDGGAAGSDEFWLRFMGEADNNLSSPCTGAGVSADTLVEIRYSVDAGKNQLICKQFDYSLDSNTKSYTALSNTSTDVILATNVKTFQIELGAYNATNKQLEFGPLGTKVTAAQLKTNTLDSVKFFLLLESEQKIGQNATPKVTVSNHIDINLDNNKLYRTFQFTGSLESMRNFTALQGT